MSLLELNDSIRKACSLPNDSGQFAMAIISAFSKSVGLVSEIEQASSESKSFWIATALRSVCEDLIVLGFIDKNFSNESDEIIKLQLSLDINKSLLAQEALFSEYRPHQPRIKPSKNTMQFKENEERLKQIFGSSLRGKNQVQPSIWHMAKDQEMHLLYEFLYHATSRLVHFSPNTLLRMAWFDPKSNISHCDPSSLDKYYFHFVKFYSAHLLSAFVNRFSDKVDIDEKLHQAIAEKIGEVNSNPRWPELVTFEELNAENPWDGDETMNRMSFLNLLIDDPGVIFECKP